MFENVLSLETCGYLVIIYNLWLALQGVYRTVYGQDLSVAVPNRNPAPFTTTYSLRHLCRVMVKYDYR